MLRAVDRYAYAVESLLVAIYLPEDKRTTKLVKAVLMVGGFGHSPYLREMIKKVVGSNAAVIQPANFHCSGPWRIGLLPWR
jgi:tRNA A37 threonylcarbamoyltransferase TsaD